MPYAQNVVAVGVTVKKMVSALEDKVNDYEGVHVQRIMGTRRKACQFQGVLNIGD